MAVLACAVLRLGSSGLEVVARRGDRLRKVLVTWHQKEVSDVPPVGWAEMVNAELDLHDSNPKAETLTPWSF